MSPSLTYLVCVMCIHVQRNRKCRSNTLLAVDLQRTRARDGLFVLFIFQFKTTHRRNMKNIARSRNKQTGSICFCFVFCISNVIARSTKKTAAKRKHSVLVVISWFSVCKTQTQSLVHMIFRSIHDRRFVSYST